MAMIETWVKCELKKAVQVQYLQGNLFSLDNQGNLVGVEVFDEGEPASLSGTVSANVIRADGGTVAVSGTLSGNKCYVVLPQAAYQVPGVVTIVIKLTASSVVTTLAAVVTTVYRSSTEAAVDPGTIISDINTLIAEIEAAVATIPADYSSLWTTLAPAYSTSSTYAVGQYVTYNGGLYRCTTAITSGESWTSGHWTAAKLGPDISDLKSALNGQIVYTSSEASSDKTFTGQSGNNEFRYVYLDPERLKRFDIAKLILKNKTVYYLMMVFTYYSSDGTALGNTGWKNVSDGEDLYNKYIKSTIVNNTAFIMVSYAFSTTTAIADRVTGINTMDYSFEIVNIDLIGEEEINENVSEQMEWLENVVGVGTTTIDQLYDSATNNLPKTAKFVLGILPKYTMVEDLQIVVAGNSDAIVKLEKWEYSSESNGYVYKEAVTADSVSAYSDITGKYVLKYLPFSVDEKTILTFSDTSSLGWVAFKSVTDGSFQKFSTSLSVVTPSDIETQTGANILYYLSYKAGGGSSSKGYAIVDINGHGDYTSVAEAVATEPSGKTIVVLPGVYDGSIRAFAKRVNIIGTDREKCIIRSTDGRYANPAMECCCGYLENLTFYSQYVSGTSQEIGSDASGAYAVHCENQSNESLAMGDCLTFVNCNLISDFFPALGCGTFANWSLNLINCRLTTNEPSGRGTYTGDGSLGAFYFHDMNGTKGTAKVNVKDCIIENTQLANTICPYDLNQENASVVCEFINNTIYSAVNGFTDSVWWRGTGGAWGNHFHLSSLSHGNTGSTFNN